jgi:single-strand DNA-binding protein
MNTVKLIGHVGADVNIMAFEKSKKASFSVATTDTYKNKENQEVKNTAWHKVVAWGKTADACEELISKGKLITVEGKIVYRTYTNSQNQTVNLTEIQAFKVEEYIKK